METKRTRGRPTGSGIPIDQTHLAAIADLIEEKPFLCPTAAIKLVEPEWTDSFVRRLSRKWREGGKHLLIEAQKRRQARAITPPKTGRSNAPENLAQSRLSCEKLASQMSPGHQNLMAIASAGGMLDSRMMQVARGDLEATARSLAIQNLTSQAMQCAAGYQKSTVGQLIETMFDSPTMRFARGHHGSDAIRAMEEITKSPTARLLLERERIWRNLCLI
ncbi:MAG: hypothetical protein ABL914_08915 [Novosphingobium sp.]|uniref:hypothetical protein n=1 Tax=Novosphingobium sp. TaxID=1874826 RepID=UPI0032BF1EE9